MLYEYSNKGRREENQDYVCHGSLSDDSGIYIVADGMGGYSEGAAASKVVAESIREYIESNFGKYSPADLLKEAIPFANDALMLKRMAMAAKKMGCVITILLISNGYAHISWLGDSRIYLFRGGKEVYRTEDHSIINDLAKIKTLSASSIEKYASIVTKSIMGESQVDNAPIAKIKIEKGDVFILCTDGFHKEFDMSKAFSYDNTQKDHLDSYSEKISDNYSFIKVIV